MKHLDIKGFHQKDVLMLMVTVGMKKGSLHAAVTSVLE